MWSVVPWKNLTPDEVLYWFGRLICLPCTLMLNFALAQYLYTVYCDRLGELRVKLLFFSSVVGVISLAPYAHPDDEFVRHMNDISECCCVLTFLLQISVICRDVAIKVKLRSITNFARAAEAFVILNLLELAGIVPSFVWTVSESTAQLLEQLDNAVEVMSLTFVCFFRFYYLSISDGLRKVVRTRKFDLLLYLLLATHELLFVLIELVTHWDWECVQGLYMRVLIVVCLWTTSREKKRNHRRRLSQPSVGAVTARSGRSRSSAGASITRRKAISEAAVSMVQDSLAGGYGPRLTARASTPGAVVVHVAPPRDSLMSASTHAGAMPE